MIGNGGLQESGQLASTRRPEASVWQSLGLLGLLVLQMPLAVLTTFGVVGFGVLWAASGSVVNALWFDVNFLLWSIVYTLPVLVAYLAGAIVRQAVRTRRSDAWMAAIAYLAPLAVFTLGLTDFSDRIGWSGLSYWSGWVSVISFVGVYVVGFGAGVTGGGRESSSS